MATETTAIDKHVLKVLRAIAEGYEVRGEDDQYVVVRNPSDGRPDKGEPPFLVVDTFDLSEAAS